MSGKASKKKAQCTDDEQAADLSEKQEAQPDQAEDAEVCREQSPADELKQLKDRFQRLAADYQNYQKRSHRQVEQASEYATEGIIRSLLPVLDNFEHTLEKGGQTGDADSLLKGVQIVHDHLVSTLQGHGISRIEVAQGGSFDPSLHEAKLHEQTDQFDANTIVRELAGGYMINGRTLRPAQVSVARPPEPQQEQDTDSQRQSDQCQDQRKRDEDS